MNLAGSNMVYEKVLSVWALWRLKWKSQGFFEFLAIYLMHGKPQLFILYFSLRWIIAILVEPLRNIYTAKNNTVESNIPLRRGHFGKSWLKIFGEAKTLSWYRDGLNGQWSRYFWPHKLHFPAFKILELFWSWKKILKKCLSSKKSRKILEKF